MKKKEMGPYKKMLLELKDELYKEVRINQEAGKEAQGEDVQDLADQASESYDRELASSLSEAERARLESVEKALGRVEEGSYGVCETCEKDIPLPRLKVLPFACLCVSCQEKEEKAAR